MLAISSPNPVEVCSLLHRRGQSLGFYACKFELNRSIRNIFSTAFSEAGQKLKSRSLFFILFSTCFHFIMGGGKRVKILLVTSQYTAYQLPKSDLPKNPSLPNSKNPSIAKIRIQSKNDDFLSDAKKITYTCPIELKLTGIKTKNVDSQMKY